MFLSLVGMSGIGKSYWAGRLAGQGFVRFDCDGLIAEQLGLATTEPENAVEALGSWSGLPTESRYQRMIDRYLACEIRVMNEILAAMAHVPAGTNLVIDTTGSVIYTGREILNHLRRQTHIVYLKTTAEIHAQMLQAYLAAPRPLVWQGLFQQATEEPLEQAFQRNYANLLTSRHQQYQQLCHLALDYEAHHRPGLTPADFLQMVIPPSEKNHV